MQMWQAEPTPDASQDQPRQPTAYVVAAASCSCIPRTCRVHAACCVSHRAAVVRIVTHVKRHCGVHRRTAAHAAVHEAATAPMPVQSRPLRLIAPIGHAFRRLPNEQRRQTNRSDTARVRASVALWAPPIGIEEPLWYTIRWVHCRQEYTHSPRSRQPVPAAPCCERTMPAGSS